MKRFISIILILVLSFSICACGQAEPVAEEVKAEPFSNDPAAIEAVSASVVMLTCYDRNGEAVCTGSAFQCFEEGIYVTNYHVIEGVDSIQANTESKLYFDIDEVVAVSEEKDVAILKTSAQPGVAVLTAGDSDNLTKGANVTAIGSPKGFLNTVSKGTYSGVTEFDDGTEYLQFNASISAGSSGGALFNDNGEVVGITSSEWTEGNDINFAVPMNTAKEIWENKEKYKAPEEPEFIAYSPSYIFENSKDFLNNTNFNVIGYYWSEGTAKSSTGRRILYYCFFISDSFDKTKHTYEGNSFIADISIELHDAAKIKVGDHVLINCSGNGLGYTINSINLTDLEPNNGESSSSGKTDIPKYISISEYFENQEQYVNKEVAIGGYISVLDKFSSGNRYFLVDDKIDIVGKIIEYPYYNNEDSNTEISEIKKAWNEESIMAFTNETDDLLPGTFVVVKGIAGYKNSDGSHNTRSTLENAKIIEVF